MKALGMIEVYGYLAAVEALDSALKAANVELAEVKKVKGGLVTVMVTGDVGAVKASIDAAASAAAGVGQVISVHVIARPAEALDKIIGAKRKLTATKPEIHAEKPKAEAQIEESEKQQSSEAVQSEKVQLTKEAVFNMTVAELRSTARELGVESMTKQEIRFAKKDEILSAILKHLEQER